MTERAASDLCDFLLEEAAMEVEHGLTLFAAGIYESAYAFAVYASTPENGVQDVSDWPTFDDWARMILDARSTHREREE